MLNRTDLSRVDLNQLVVFEAVMEARHVGRAAELLNLSPSAVSHALGRLRGLLDDPLFLRTPKGVCATDRAEQLGPAIAEILARVREIVASSTPFDPGRSARRFRIGAPDGVSAVLLPSLLARLRQSAPGVALSMVDVLPQQGETSPSLAWRGALTDLETRAIDAAIIPTDEVPARFIAKNLYEEDFVLAMRSGHPLADKPTLRSYCAAQHLVVSKSGDATGFVDAALEARGLARHVGITAPNFMFALALLAQTDLVTAIPRRFGAIHAARFGSVCTEAPIDLPRFKLSLVTPKAAIGDSGLAWLAGLLAEVADLHRWPTGASSAPKA